MFAKTSEEKLCFSAVFELNETGIIKSRMVWKNRLFLSDHRFTYEEAQDIIEKQKGLYSNELSILNSLSKKMRSERIDSGAFSTFERSETKFKLNEEGNPINIYLKESKDAHKLIEEFMLLANKRVAEFIGKRNFLLFIESMMIQILKN